MAFLPNNHYYVQNYLISSKKLYIRDSFSSALQI